MWNRRRETQAEAADAVAQILEPASAVPPAGSAAPETETPPSLGAETQGPRAGEQLAPPAEETMNGAVQATPPAIDERTQQFWRSKLHTANFGGAVALFMRSPAHKHYSLADLEWLLIPPLRHNQFMAAEVKLPNGQAVPAALVLWARVSAEVDARLTAESRYPVRLRPNEWQSGEVFWIVEAVGEAEAVRQCMEALANAALRGKQFKMLQRPDGRSPVRAEEHVSGG